MASGHHRTLRLLERLSSYIDSIKYSEEPPTHSRADAEREEGARKRGNEGEKPGEEKVEFRKRHGEK